jgi:hypothetical protein
VEVAYPHIFVPLVCFLDSCDFNQQLGYTMGNDKVSIQQGGLTVFDLKSLDELSDVMIRNDNHCFGCTAGMGSS